MIRVVIVEDHTLVRSGFRLLLEAEKDMTVEDEAGDADQAVRLARLHKPDVVLLDLVMPGRGGLEAIPAIRKARPRHRSSCSRCTTTQATCAQRSPPARAAICSKTPPTPSSSRRFARWPPADATSTPPWEYGSRKPRHIRLRRMTALRARARGTAAARARQHQPGDRKDALHLGPHRRDTPGAHHEKARPLHPRRTRQPRTPPGPPRPAGSGRAWAHDLTADGRCETCGAGCAGVFEGRPGRWRARRLSVRVGTA